MPALLSKRVQLVEMRKRLLAQIRARQKPGTAAMSEHIDTELTQRIDSLSKEVEDRVTLAIASVHRLSDPAIVLRSIPAIGPVASDADRRDAQDGWRPHLRRGCTHGLRSRMTPDPSVAGHRRRPPGLRHAMFRAALVAAHHDPNLKTFEDRLRDAENRTTSSSPPLPESSSPSRTPCARAAGNGPPQRSKGDWC